MRIIMIVFLSVILLLALTTWIIVSQKKFGTLPAGARLERIKASPNYRDGSFQNQSFTPTLTEGVSYTDALKDFVFTSVPGKTPPKPLPSEKTNLFDLPPHDDVLVWFGHSSYFLQTGGKKLLVDPVFSGSASPFSFTTKSFPGTDRYSPSDIPALDYLILSHDHWDHLDFATVTALREKTAHVITGLGTGAHLEAWGFDPAKITELDWYQAFTGPDGFVFTATPARHFSGRGFVRNKALWISLVVQAPGATLYLGGDSGFDTHFAEIGQRFGPFDLAVLDNGQYDKSWRYVHMLPDEVLQAAVDLNTRVLLPVHNSKFVLGNHAWDAPLQTITSLHKPGDYRLITPRIGAATHWNDTVRVNEHWWKTL
jgi:L-ascorbate metabolism protein UlaG (beta-lactamase superfamily)